MPKKRAQADSGSSSASKKQKTEKTSISIKSEEDEDAEFITRYTATMTGGKKPIGTLEATFIDRDEIRDCFHGFMDEPSQEISNLGLQLFNGAGRLKKVHAGTFSVDDLSTGAILYIDNIEVDPASRGQGLSFELIQAVIDKCSPGVVLMEPFPQQEGKDGDEQEEEDDEDAQKKKEEATLEKCHRLAKYFRKANFRRVGKTEYLACVPTCSDDHPSKDQKAEDPPPPKPFSPGDWTLEEYPLQHGTCRDTVTEEEFATLVQKHKKDIDLQDPMGNTAVHCAVIARKPEKLKVLLESGASPTIKNNEGFIPVDMLLAAVESNDEFIELFQSPWSTDAPVSIDSVYVSLLKLLVPATKDCLVCTDLNPISPRMGMRLKVTARELADATKALMPEFNKDGTLTSDLAWGMIGGITALPMEVAEPITEEVAWGWQKMLAAVADTLDADIEPTATNVTKKLEESKKEIAELEKRGGRVEYAIQAVLKTAHDEHEDSGDGSFAKHASKLEGLPRHLHDNAFGVVFHHLHNAGFFPKHKYPWVEGDDEEGEGVSDDDDDVEGDDGDEGSE
eukprot:TRINITY_DN63466_c0_g1_i2.p1 TRINITY_DN63466_c0_g1~~TRINITY_DN63466_c0_g1_i2.p1  ORF type:complete len:564 (+),score=91.05 TRINITY_DN63466_c0_g1_i2:19-1710(+)